MSNYFSNKKEFVLKYQPDSVLDYLWDDGINNWNHNKRIIYYFDSIGNLTKELASNWDDDEWEPKEKIDYFFSDSLITQQTNFWWDWYYDEWSFNVQKYFVYDSSNNLVQNHIFQWSDEILDWENDSLYKFEYDSLNRKIIVNNQTWSKIFSNWENVLQTKYYYDSIGNILEKIELEWEFDLLIWEPKRKIIFIYDSNHALIEQTEVVRDDNSWKNNRKKEYSYHENGLIKDFSQYIWVSINNSESWLEDFKFSYEYNENNEIIEEAEYLFDWDLLIWEKNYLTSYDYFDDNLLRTISYNQWQNNRWKELELSKFYYTNHTGISISKLNYDEILVFPVPTSYKLTIVIPDEYFGEKQVRFFDLYGREIKKYHYMGNSSNIEIILSDLVSGIYFLQITIDNKSFSKRIIKV
jgi:Secretion system C-terminal sorting domain